jgi:two-component system, LytTR family, sensor kinase
MVFPDAPQCKNVAWRIIPMLEATLEPQAVPAEDRKTFGYPGPLVHILAWTLVGLLAFGRHVLQCGDAGLAKLAWPELLTWMSCFCSAALFGTLIFRCEKRYPLGGQRWGRNIAVLAALGVLFAYVACQIASNICSGVDYLYGLSPTFAWPGWSVSKGELTIQFFLFWIVVGASYVFRHFLQLQSREREKTELLLEKSRLQASLKHAELEALRMRLNPHFLFNTLQNISVLTQEDPRTASQMLTRLGDLLRTAIRSGAEQETDLATEVRLTEAYASMEKMRFGERLHIDFEIAPETSGAMVPTLLLQPLLENAIKHGLQGVSREGFIAVRASRANAQLLLSVKDNGIGPATDSLEKKDVGIGLGATTQRLARLYPGESQLTMSGSRDSGTEVRIVLPFRAAPASMERHDQAALAHC